MNVEITYGGKLLKDLDVWSLELAMKQLLDAEAKREEASEHHKFDKLNNKKAMDFPPPNPKFLELKDAIKKEIESRKNE